MDCDGNLNLVELGYWMEKHGSPVSPRQLRCIMKTVDADADGLLNFSEFLVLCQKVGLQDVITMDHPAEHIHHLLFSGSENTGDYADLEHEQSSSAGNKYNVQLESTVFETRVPEMVHYFETKVYALYFEWNAVSAVCSYEGYIRCRVKSYISTLILLPANQMSIGRGGKSALIGSEKYERIVVKASSAPLYCVRFFVNYCF